MNFQGIKITICVITEDIIMSEEKMQEWLQILFGKNAVQKKWALGNET